MLNSSPQKLGSFIQRKLNELAQKYPDFCEDLQEIANEVREKILKEALIKASAESRKLNLRERRHLCSQVEHFLEKAIRGLNLKEELRRELEMDILNIRLYIRPILSRPNIDTSPIEEDFILSPDEEYTPPDLFTEPLPLGEADKSTQESVAPAAEEPEPEPEPEPAPESAEEPVDTPTDAEVEKRDFASQTEAEMETPPKKLELNAEEVKAWDAYLEALEKKDNEAILETGKAALSVIGEDCYIGDVNCVTHIKGWIASTYKKELKDVWEWEDWSQVIEVADHYLKYADSPKKEAIALLVKAKATEIQSGKRQTKKDVEQFCKEAMALAGDEEIVQEQYHEFFVRPKQLKRHKFVYRALIVALLSLIGINVDYATGGKIGLFFANLPKNITQYRLNHQWNELIKKAEAASEQKSFPEAGEFFEQAYKLDPNKRYALYSYLKAMIDNKERVDLDALIREKINPMLKKCPEDSELYFLLGQALLQKGDHEKASDAFAEAHKLDPEDITYTIHYISTLLQLGQQQEALAQAEEALKKQAGNLDLIFLKATALKHLDGDMEEALKLIEKVIAEGLGETNIHKRLAWSYWIKSGLLYNQGANDLSDFYESRNKDKKEEAEKKFKSSLVALQSAERGLREEKPELDKDFAYIYLNLGDTSEGDNQINNYRKAENLFSKLHKKDQGNKEYLRLHAAVCNALAEIYKKRTKSAKIEKDRESNKAEWHRYKKKKNKSSKELKKLRTIRMRPSSVESIFPERQREERRPRRKGKRGKSRR